MSSTFGTPSALRRKLVDLSPAWHPNSGDQSSGGALVNSDAFSPTLRRHGDPQSAFDPPTDASDQPSGHPGMIAADAFSPTSVSPTSSSDASRSPTGGATGPGPEQQYMKDLQDVSGKLSAAYAAPHAGVARQILGALVSHNNPQLGGLVSGETQRDRTIQPLQQQYGVLANALNASRQFDLANSTINRNNAYANFEGNRQDIADANRKATAARNRNTVEEGLQKSHLHGTWDADDTLTGTTPFSANELPPPATPANKNTPPKINYDQGIPVSVTDSNKTEYDINDPHLPAELMPLVKSAAAAHKQHVQEIADAQQRSFTQQDKSQQSREAVKPTADETRRGDLARNLSENLDQLEELATRRPDLFGPAAGRLTSAKQWLGTSDPDVAALQNIKEQTGLAMVGTHAMRNAAHAEKAADSIINAYKNEPEALLGKNGSIATARASLKTFLADEARKGGPGGSGAANPGQAVGASDDPFSQFGGKKR